MDIRYKILTMLVNLFDKDLICLTIRVAELCAGSITWFSILTCRTKNKTVVFFTSSGQFRPNKKICVFPVIDRTLRLFYIISCLQARWKCSVLNRNCLYRWPPSETGKWIATEADLMLLKLGTRNRKPKIRNRKPGTRNRDRRTGN